MSQRENLGLPGVATSGEHVPTATKLALCSSAGVGGFRVGAG
jgi:hypothetical protein